ncbi:FAD-binding protein [Frankia sp. Cpl3]|uniref:FAD-binding protein n=1 Tax=Parafrankia colletiae TaxID=573497 RepID=UPI0018E37990|nr:FAD-binding protein [Parafrankia colletiae]MCK9904906.1 FAD-binding protein [Frankia sp. Cpl3]
MFPTGALPPLDGELSLDAGVRAAAADDFGHVVEKTPLGVLRPASARDVAVVTRWAAENGLKVAARGRGHSTFGRSQVDAGIVVDMAYFDEIHRVGDDRVTVGAGTTWRSVVAATLPDHLTPPVLPNYLDLSVGGTLSVGGIGVSTHQYGMQTDNVCELEVVTGDGEILICSPETNSELFNSVRAGLGQFGVIIRATLTLVPAPDRARTYVLSYADLEGLAADQQLLLRRGGVDHLRGSIVLDDDAWQHQLEIAVLLGADDHPDDDVVLAGLADDRSHAQIDDLSYAEYLEAFDRFTELLCSTGEWADPHPWWMTFLPGSVAVKVAHEVIADLVSEDLGGHGFVVFYPLDKGQITTPLVRMPNEEIVFVFNLVRFASTGPEHVERLLEQNWTLYRRVLTAGGVLYPVSAFPLTPEEWEKHFGSAWPMVREAKGRFDPSRCFTPGYEVF